MKNNRFAYNREYYENRYSQAVVGNTARRLKTDSLYAEEEDYASDSALYEEDAPEYDEADELYEQYADYEDDYAEELEQVEEEYAPEYETVRKVRNRFVVRTNPVGILAFTVIICALFLSAYRFVDTKSKISELTENISKAKTELSTIQSRNEYISSALDTNLDRNYIYNVAVGRLGMVYPDKNETIKYQPADSGYVRQYRNIR